ncbi:hypothetical protein [Paraburkholderia domus]|uniref:hypothetical protein n=1 Tax=Paraburkholderia domus TaxID=2793075 RepID=UPI001912DFB2|nr:hypothetical protein [Paraburkholderia domus]MBK5058825.1 hypothetical protein [Burkholderia sp. R-70199]CAE6878870.1 hypothetical protein R70199_02390 [Paraburkholderia domus]
MDVQVFWSWDLSESDLSFFVPSSIEELWDAYRRHPCAEARTLMMEIVLLRELVQELESYEEVVQRCWRKEVGEQLVALERMRDLFAGERARRGERKSTLVVPQGSERKIPQKR